MKQDWPASSPEDSYSLSSSDGFDLLSDELRARVKSELEPGERLIWADRSDPPLEPIGMGFYVLAAIAVISMILGTIGVLRPNRRPDDSAFTFGLIAWSIAGLIVIGLPAKMVSRDKQRRRDRAVCYAITERRAIIWTPESKGNAVRIRTFPRGEIRSLVRVQHPDGSGSVLFNSEASDENFYVPIEWRSPGFLHIADVRRVEQIVRNNLIGSDRSA
jgi:hypothetical protein